MIEYIVFTIIAILLSLFIFIKVKFRFWSQQPVFHIYNLRYWLFPPGIVQHNSPPVTKYYDYKILCDTYDNLSTEKKELLYSLIKTHFLYKRDVKYIPTKSDIMEYFHGQNEHSFISLCYKYFCEFNKKTQHYSYAKKLVGCMTSRTLECSIEDKTIKTSYVDFLCVHKKYRKKGYAPKIIYTHYKKSRDAGAPVIFLFKREGNINFMIPLTVYYAYTFSTKIWNRVNMNLPNNISCSLITSSNTDLLFHYFQEMRDHFKCFITPVFSNLKNQIDKNLLLPVILLDKENPIGCFFFKNPQTSYDGKKSMECLASYVTPGYEEIFTDSFTNAITLVNKKIPFELFIIENISNNNYIIKEILKKDVLLWKVPMAYYFYNFIYHPFTSPNVFLLN
jgi:ribosomal protein S18 acetylase RimI-like enzyme